ncbi:hypothetical protein SDC9_86648 [bioreactor metagenome]|uniref:Uncharacterized protein n=1 Tax=bioreactor metagenome TaxID=1076179 RepID=A0A644ZGN4_9ZZZZ
MLLLEGGLLIIGNRLIDESKQRNDQSHHQEGIIHTQTFLSHGKRHRQQDDPDCSCLEKPEGTEPHERIALVVEAMVNLGGKDAAEQVRAQTHCP